MRGAAFSIPRIKLAVFLESAAKQTPSSERAKATNRKTLNRGGWTVIYIEARTLKKRPYKVVRHVRRFIALACEKTAQAA
jgi:very-short-patch-repair endonuclease